MEKRDADGLPIIAPPPKLLFCIRCQRRFDPKLDRSHYTHSVIDHHPNGMRHGSVASDDPTFTAKEEARFPVGIGGWDRCTGGGMVEASAIIIGGTTGVGKTTILGEVLYLACSKLRAHALYVSSEETEDQVRLKLRKNNITHPRLRVAHTNSMEDVERLIAEHRPHIVVVDSVNRMTTIHAKDAKVGTVPAILAVTERCVRLAKKTKIKPIVIAVGHENKEGEIAGPQGSLHDYDVILHFRKLGALRELETEKNRFGEAPVSATFEFRGGRLVEVKDAASEVLPLTSGGVGCVLFPSIVGVATRGVGFVLPVEAFASTKREEGEAAPRPPSGQGVTDDRVRDVLDALAEHTAVSWKGRSVRAKVRRPATDGNANVTDPAIDAALALAIASSIDRRVVPERVAAFGELSPSGRMEPAPDAETRIRAAATAGAKTIIGPLVRGGIPPAATMEAAGASDVRYVACSDLAAVVRYVLDECAESRRHADTAGDAPISVSTPSLSEVDPKVVPPWDDDNASGTV